MSLSYHSNDLYENLWKILEKISAKSLNCPNKELQKYTLIAKCLNLILLPYKDWIKDYRNSKEEIQSKLSENF